MEKEPGLTLLLGRETTAVLSEFIRSSPKSFTPRLHLPPSPYVWLLQASALETPDGALFQMECTCLKNLGPAESNYPKRLFALLCYVWYKWQACSSRAGVCLLYSNPQIFEKTNENVYRGNWQTCVKRTQEKTFPIQSDLCKGSAFLN